MTANQNSYNRLGVSPAAGHFGCTMFGLVSLVLLFGATSVIAEEKSDDQLDSQTVIEPAKSDTSKMVVVLPGAQPLLELGTIPEFAYKADSSRNAIIQTWSPPEFMYDAYGDWEVGVGTHRAVGLVVRLPFK